MNKLHSILLIACVSIGFASCSDDDCEDLHLDNLAHYPNVLKGTFPTENQVLNMGETLEITPKLLNLENTTYSWLINGEEYSNEHTFSYKVEKPCRANLTCIISNEYGKVEMNTSFNSNHDFSKGFLYIDDTFNFYDTEKKVKYEDCYSSLNAGKKLGADKPSICSNNGKLYILNNSSTSNADHLFVVDSKTLYYEKSATVGTHLHGMVILNDQYALAGGDGIRRINLKSLSNVSLTKNSSYSLFNGVVYNGKVMVNDTYGDPSQVKCYNVSDLLAAKENEMPSATEPGLEITQNQKINFVQAKDGNVYTLESTDEGCSIVQIDKNFTVQKTPINFKPAKGPYWSSPTVGMVASETEGIIYIASADNSIYKYIIGNPNSIKEPFISADESGLPIAATLQLNQKTGELYVIYGEQWEDYKIVTYNKNGEQINSIDCGENGPSHIIFNN